MMFRVTGGNGHGTTISTGNVKNNYGILKNGLCDVRDKNRKIADVVARPDSKLFDGYFRKDIEKAYSLARATNARVLELVDDYFVVIQPLKGYESLGERPPFKQTKMLQ